MSLLRYLRYCSGSVYLKIMRVLLHTTARIYYRYDMYDIHTGIAEHNRKTHNPTTSNEDRVVLGSRCEDIVRPPIVCVGEVLGSKKDLITGFQVENLDPGLTYACDASIALRLLQLLHLNF